MSERWLVGGGAYYYYDTTTTLAATVAATTCITSSSTRNYYDTPTSMETTNQVACISPAAINADETISSSALAFEYIQSRGFRISHPSDLSLQANSLLLAVRYSSYPPFPLPNRTMIRK